MADLTKCCDDCQPELQTRGLMGEGDYFGVISDGSFTSAEPPGSPAHDHHLFVQVSDNNKADVRVACRKCAMQTGWFVPDGPNMPGIGKEYIARLWSDQVADKLQRAAMLLCLQEKFGKDAIKKFFGKSL